MHRIKRERKLTDKNKTNEIDQIELMSLFVARPYKFPQRSDGHQMKTTEKGSRKEVNKTNRLYLSRVTSFTYSQTSLHGRPYIKSLSDPYSGPPFFPHLPRLLLLVRFVIICGYMCFYA